MSSYIHSGVSGELCKEYGHYCNAPSRCCGSKCCSDQDYDTSMISYYRWNLWNMWYFWFIIVFILMSCFGGCGYYKRRQMLFARQRASGVSLAPSGRASRHSSRVPVSVALPIYPHAYAYTGPAADPGAYFMAPPPYSEVVSQPELYPVNKAELPPYPGEEAPPTVPQAPPTVPQLNAANTATSHTAPVPPHTTPEPTSASSHPTPAAPAYSGEDRTTSTATPSQEAPLGGSAPGGAAPNNTPPSPSFGRGEVY